MNQFSNKFRHLIWPLVSLALLLLFNAIFTDNFFKIEIKSADSPNKAVRTAVPENPPVTGSARLSPENYEGASDSAEVITEIDEAAEEAVEQLQPAAQPAAQPAPQKQESKGVSIFGYYLYGTPIDILNQGAKVMVLAIGMTLVIATGGIDISVGAVMAIAGAIAALLISMLDAGNFPGSSLGPNGNNSHINGI